MPEPVPELCRRIRQNELFSHLYMERQTTIKDIAVALRLSKSTVSRALRDAPDIKIETKKAVKALAEELDYQPNKLALSLLNRQTHTIGVIIPNLDYVLSTMVKGIDEVALEAGYTVMVCQSDESFGREIVNTKRLLESLVDGFIVSVSSETKVFEHIKKIQNKKIPLVLFDRVVNHISCPSVRLDNIAGGVLATQHLVDQGYKRIAILAGPENLNISNKRMEGYLQTLKLNGLRPDKRMIIHCDFNQQYAYEATKELLAMKQPPDAIFTISDRMAIGAMLAIKEKGLQMPDDIGLVGFNNEPVTSLVSPSISSVEMYAFEMGKATAKLFIEMLNSDDTMAHQEIVIKPKLFIRESSKRIITKKDRNNSA
ncbi:MAG: LacI family transcriptional regulator [Ferruginibacter sp.]|nr:LacI family transcriptional regulator [Ferruginibacter sp.]